jgi:transposase
MFLKKYQRKKNGKSHTYWGLVESYRTPRGPRHRIVSYLGELDESHKKGWALLARTLDSQGMPIVHPTLFDPVPASEAVPDEVTVKIGGVRVETTKDFGDIWLGLHLWQTLQLDKLFKKILPRGKEDIEWDLMVLILALARFCEPSSELHVEDTWYPRTALSEMLGIGTEKVYVQRLYRTLDVLHPHKEAIEKHLKQRLGELFNTQYDLLLYDVTSTYFEGEARRNPQAKLGYSRDKRPDCKQVCLGLVVTPEGFPLGYEVFDGNRNDVTTIAEIVESMEQKYGRARRIWVLDRGMVNEGNLEFIRERGGHYLVGTPRSALKKYERELAQSDWTRVYEDVEVKLCPAPEGEETYVLCRSQDRAKKEQAMHERFSRRIEEGLLSLERRLSRAQKRPNPSQVERQVGRLLQRNSRAAGKYVIQVKKDPMRKGHLKLHWKCKKEWSDWARLSEGAYLLRTNLNNRSPEELWKTYIQLVDVEEAFRTVKTELNLRPIYHHKQNRVQAHILVAFLSYVMWKTLQKWMVSSGLGRGVRTVLEEFARIKCCEVILPTDIGQEIQLRCITKPDEGQEVLLRHLKVKFPARLGQPRWRKTCKL